MFPSYIINIHIIALVCTFNLITHDRRGGSLRLRVEYRTVMTRGAEAPLSFSIDQRKDLYL